jgi:hypothetical protein
MFMGIRRSRMRKIDAKFIETIFDALNKKEQG